MDKRRDSMYYRLIMPPAAPEYASLRINSAPSVYRCEEGWNWAPPPLRDHDFWFVVGGSGTLERNGRPKVVSAGSCVVLAPGDTPRGTQNPRDRLTVFYAHFDILDAGGNVAPPLNFPEQIEVQDTLSLASSAHRIVRLWQRGGELAQHQAQLILSTLVWQLWDEISFPVSPTSEAFERLAADIRREPGHRWTLDTMADRACLSRAQFARRFREIFDTSPTRFVIQTRLERARYLLSETEMTVSQVSLALGYSDVYFFARQFKQFTGKAPGGVRNRR